MQSLPTEYDANLDDADVITQQKAAARDRESVGADDRFPVAVEAGRSCDRNGGEHRNDVTNESTTEASDDSSDDDDDDDIALFASVRLEAGRVFTPDA